MAEPEPRSGRGGLTLAFLQVVPALAALDAVLVRLDHANWAVEPGLFGHMLLLWGALGLLALVPAALTLRLGRGRLSAPLALGAWLVLPLVCHGVLDSFTALSQGLSSLMRPGPWLACAGAALVALVVLLLAERVVLWLGLTQRRTAGVVLPAALVAGAFLPLRSAWRGPDVEASAVRPNVLLLVVDTVRARSMEAFGGDRETSPNLTRLADEGLRFPDARSVSNFTFTSHLSMLTGVYPSEHGAWLLDMRYDPQRASHVAVELNEAGYRTGAFVGTDVLVATSGIGWGFEVYEDRVDPGSTYGAAWALIHDLQSTAASLVPALSFHGRPHWIQDFQRPADGVLEETLAWIDQDDDRPWFAMVNLYDVHWPYLPAEPYERAYVDPAYAGPVDGFADRNTNLPQGYEMSAADDAHLTDLYEAELAELDEKLGRFFAALDLENTAILVTADHGEAFGEGGRYEHNDILEPQVHVPFILRPPGGLEQGLTEDLPVSGIDVAATLMGLAGVEPPGGMRGMDLTTRLPEAARLRLVEDRDHLSAEQNHYAIYRDGWKFVRVGSRAEGAGLFWLADDPDGLDDVSGEHPELAAELDALLDAERAKWGADQEVLEAGSHVAEGLGGLGYLGD